MDLKQKLSQLKQQLETNKKALANTQVSLNTQNSVLLQLRFNQEHQNKRLENLQQQIIDTQQTIETNTKAIFLIIQAEADLNEHLQVLKKMDTLVKRDFRGYLLSSVIDFINKN